MTRVFIRSNEKIFTVDVVTNTQNDKLYARDAEDILESSRTHLRRMKSAGVMVWAAVSYGESKSLFVFTEKSVKVNTDDLVIG